MIFVRPCAFVYVRVCVTFSRSPIKVSRFYIAEYITNTRFYIAEHILNVSLCREAVARGQEKSRNQTSDGIE